MICLIYCPPLTATPGLLYPGDNWPSGTVACVVDVSSAHQYSSLSVFPC